ncbi:hypothetical protein CDD82_5504 [Ophiocordyceps australis]|uniref:FAM50A/XAP5 C-terminal domain-containing protein n=1 Tax=Ophiocordyceps australis TaxID=1399860 RepID=A0A2C5Y3X9_9HYPO|nr:hypothetical protein CDD82_5504 [Ophiocordyceps australis]
MADPSASRFAPQNKSTHERLSTNTVGLVALSDYRKRRAEVLEQQERESREAALSATRVATPDSPHTPTPEGAGSKSPAHSQSQLAQRNKKKQKLRPSNKLLSFDHGDYDDPDASDPSASNSEAKGNDSKSPPNGGQGSDPTTTGPKFKPNASVAVMPKVVTKAALRKEAAEREALRREFLAIQEAVKACEIAIPFVFYDGVNTPGGTVRIKKGDFVWVFLDKSRKLAAQRVAVGEHRAPRRSWARVGVDDLMLVRDTVIIPHHYDFYFFIMNKSLGPSGRLLFDYSSQAPAKPPNEATGLSNPALPAVETEALEGASDNAIVTKVVDRRWYERNKHIYPASTWQEFDPEKDFAGQIAKDTGGNTFFFAR